MRQLVLNKLALSLWCAWGCFVFNGSYFSSTSKTLSKAGHHLPSNTECKTVPSPNRWWSQCVLEVKGRMQWSKGVVQKGSSSQASIRLMAKWRLEVGFPGTVACIHFSSHPSHHTCTFGLKWNLSSCPWQTVCLGRLPEYFFSKHIPSALLTVRISPHKHS